MDPEVSNSDFDILEEYPMKITREEADMIKAISKKRKVEEKLAIFNSVMPAIQKIIKSGGSADQILKTSEPFAAAELTRLALEGEREDTRRQAISDILNRTQGKPVERSLHIYGDLQKKSDEELDQDIVRLLSGKDSQKFLAEVLDVTPPKKHKPKKNEIIDAEVGDGTPEEDV